MNNIENSIKRESLDDSEENKRIKIEKEEILTETEDNTVIVLSDEQNSIQEDTSVMAEHLQSFMERIQDFVTKYNDILKNLLEEIAVMKRESLECIHEIDNDKEAIEKQLVFLTEKTLSLQETILHLVNSYSTQ